MKILFRVPQLLLTASVVALFASCGDNKAATDSAAQQSTTEESALLNIRYIDKDSLIRNYNLAKDLNEVMLRSSGNYDNIRRQKEAEIQKFYSSIENKYKSNGYLSEQSFQADQQKLQKMQNDAQEYLANLERSIQDEMLQNNIQLNDSVENFIKDYNSKKGYDIIFSKDATLFIDSKYDITQEVIEGLNARYAKVDKKK